MPDFLACNYFVSQGTYFLFSLWNHPKYWAALMEKPPCLVCGVEGSETVSQASRATGTETAAETA